MMIAKQGIVITHAIALTALLIVAMGWQAQVQKKSTHSPTGSVKPSFFDASGVVPPASGTAL
jgi:hypothetical protein